MGKEGKNEAGGGDTGWGGGRGNEGQRTWAPILKLPPAIGPSGLQLPRVSDGLGESGIWGDDKVGSPNNHGKVPGGAHHVPGPVKRALYNLAGFILTVREGLASPLL